MAEVCGLDIPPQSGLPVMVEVDATRASEGDALSAVASPHKGGSTAQVNIEETEPKKFKLTFQPPKEDIYTLDIKWGESHIQGSPLHLDLRPPNAKGVTIAEPPAGKLKAGQQISICFDTSNAGRGEMQSTCNGEEVGEIDVDVKRRDFTNKFDVSFKPPHEDEYVIIVKWAGKGIKGSPFKIDLIPVNPDKVKASAPKIPENPDDPIEMEISTKGAGNAKLTATCMGTIGGKVPVNIKKVTQHDYHLSVKPPGRDMLSLSVQYGGKHIPNSPFLVNTLPTDASKVKVTEPENPEIGQVVCYKLNTLHAGAGSLNASCVGERSGPVDVEIKKEGATSNKYTATFTPNSADVYTVEIKWGADGTPPTDVPGSPFKLSLLPPSKPDLVKHLETKQPEQRGGPAVLLFDTEEAGSGEFRARVAGLLTGQTTAPYDLAPGSQHVYKVSFSPHLADTYLVDVYWEDNPVPGSPFYVEIVYPDEVIVTEPDHNSLSLEHPFHFDVDTAKAGPGKLTAKCEIKTKGKEVDAMIVEDPEEPDKYAVSVHPSVEGLYTVSILFNQNHVKGSPFDIDLTPQKEVDESQTMVRIQDTEKEITIDVTLRSSPQAQPPAPKPVPKALQMFIGEPFSYVVGKENLEDLNSMAATAVGEKTGPAQVVTKQNEDDLPCFCFNPDVADKYTVEIRMNGTLLAGNSFIVDYIYPIDASKCVIFGAEGLTGKLPVSENVSFGVDASRAGNGKLSVNVDGPSSLSQTTKIHMTSTEENPNVYNISYSPAARGTHRINLQWAGEPIPGSPVVLDVDSSGDIPTFYLHEPFVIHFTTDCDPKEVESYAVHDDSCNRYVMKIGRRRKGKLMLVLFAKLPGIHNIHILIGGKEIHGSPYKVLFVEADPSACKVVNLPEKPFVGEETSFKIDAKKAGIGNMHIRAKVPHGGCTDVTHVDHRNGLYSILFTPKVPGTHFFQVLWDNVAIPNSPVKVDVVPADPELLASRQAASKVYILKEDMSIFGEVLPTSDPAFFHLCTEDAGKGQLTIRATGPCEASIKVVDQNDGTYRCSVKPRASGKYLISILWNSFSILGSPFQLNFTEEKSHMICGLNLETDYFSIGTPREYIIDCGKEQGKLKVDCQPSDVADLELTPVEGRHNYTYLCKITPKIMGNHVIHIKYNDKHILDSPYVVQFYDVDHHVHQRDQADEEERLSTLGSLNLVEEGQDDESPDVTTSSNPMKVKAYGPGLKGGYVGQEGNFTIETAEAGDGKLEMNVRGHKDTFKINMRHHPDSDRTIMGRFDPKHPGEYAIDITWSGAPIPGSPFIVNIVDQKQLVYTFEL